MEVRLKLCRSCKEEKPLWAFYRNMRSPDGLYYKCGDCVRKQKKPTDLDRMRKQGIAEFDGWKK